MAEIRITRNADIDQATAEIAVALRHEHPGSNDEYCYREAERLRDAIMAGTRELDHEVALQAARDGHPAYIGPNGNERPGEHWNARLIREAAEASDDRNLREHTERTRAAYPSPSYGQRQPMGDDAGWHDA